MSIVDGIASLEDTGEALKLMGASIEKAVDSLKLNDVQKKALALMAEGISLGDIVGLTEKDRNALLVQALRVLQAGQTAKARDMLVTLYQLEPLDERVLYAIATTFQGEGDVATAAKLYVHAVALDATNPDGHLRLGECFLAAREYDNAVDSFEIALGLARKGHGRPDQAPYAERMLAVVQEAAARAA